MRALFVVSLVTALISPNLLRGDETSKPIKDGIDEAIKKAISDLKSERRAQIDAKVKAIENTKKDLKNAYLADDQNKIVDLQKSFETHQASLRGLITAPLGDGGSLNLKSLKKGEIGDLPFDFKVLQVLKNSEVGSALIVPTSRALSRESELLFKVSGIDTTNLVDQADFRSDSVFVVLGTYTYTPVRGGTRTIFEFGRLPKVPTFTPDDSAKLNEIATERYSVKLTEEEQKKVQELKEIRAAQQAQRAKDKEVQDERQRALLKAKQDQEKAKKAQMFVDFGKTHLKKNNTAGAKKEFEKAVRESPDSAAGLEAKKLLEGLQ